MGVSPVDGDPASCSATAATLRRLSLGLRTDASRVAGAYAALEGRWSGRASLAARRQGEALVGTARRVAETTDEVGAAIQRYAAELAGLLDEAAAVSQAAGAAGLVVTGDGVHHPPGVHAVADAGKVAAAEQRRAMFDARLREIAVRQRAVATELAAHVDEAGSRLAGLAAALRLA